LVLFHHQKHGGAATWCTATVLEQSKISSNQSKKVKKVTLCQTLRFIEKYVLAKGSKKSSLEVIFDLVDHTFLCSCCVGLSLCSKSKDHSRITRKSV